MIGTKGAGLWFYLRELQELTYENMKTTNLDLIIQNPVISELLY